MGILNDGRGPWSANLVKHWNAAWQGGRGCMETETQVKTEQSLWCEAISSSLILWQWGDESKNSFVGIFKILILRGIIIMVNHMKKNKKSIHFPPYIRFYAQKKENLILIPLSFEFYFFLFWILLVSLSVSGSLEHETAKHASLIFFSFYRFFFYFGDIRITRSFRETSRAQIHVPLRQQRITR